MRVRVLPEAEKELLEAAHWYSQQSVGLDYEFIRCIDEATARIGRTPLMFPVVHRGRRRIIVKRFPYSIIFDVMEDEILIYAIFHFSRSPKRWKRRSKNETV
jgi:plasmid stabilization system protein ParE